MFKALQTAAEQVKTAVCKTRYAVKEARAKGAEKGRLITAHEMQGKDQRAQQFKQEGDPEDEENQIDHPLQGQLVLISADHHALPQADLVSPHDEKQGAKGHYTNTSELHQKSKDKFARRVEGVIRVNDCQTGNTDGAGSSKQGVDQAEFHTRPQ